jgi:hypothetical protein
MQNREGFGVGQLIKTASAFWVGWDCKQDRKAPKGSAIWGLGSSFLTSIQK